MDIVAIKGIFGKKKSHTCETQQSFIRVDLLFPDWWELLSLLVVTSKSVDPALDQNQPKLGVFVLSVPLQMLTNSHSLLDKVVEILGNFRSKT